MPSGRQRDRLMLSLWMSVVSRVGSVWCSVVLRVCSVCCSVVVVVFALGLFTTIGTTASIGQQCPIHKVNMPILGKMIEYIFQ